MPGNISPRWNSRNTPPVTEPRSQSSVVQSSRIAVFLATSGHSGVDRIMRNLIPEIAARGYRVDLLQVREHGPYLETLPANVTRIDLGHRHTYSCLPALVRYLRRHRPLLLLSDKDRVNRTALLARWLSGTNTPLIFRLGTTVSINLASRGRFDRWLQRTSIGRLYRFSQRVLVPSRGVADDLSAYTGLSPEKIRVVPSPGIPDDLFDRTLPLPDHPWFREPELPVILSAGELGARKDFATLLRAFTLLRARRPCRLVIIGRGKQREQLLELADTLGIRADVDLPGFVENPYSYMAHADLFAFSSRWEGLGLVLVEALALGTPVVATDCPSGPAEILQHGRFGQLVPVGDPGALARAMEATLDEKKSRDFLQQAATPYTVSAATDAYLSAMALPLRVDRRP
jgi:glycosyltransferase involved in cell wall biosynthesis